MRSVFFVLLLCIVPQFSWQLDGDDHDVDPLSDDAINLDIADSKDAVDASVRAEDKAPAKDEKPRKPEDLLAILNLDGLLNCVDNHEIVNHKHEDVSAVYHTFDIKTANCTCSLQILDVQQKNMTLLGNSTCTVGDKKDPMKLIFVPAYMNNETGECYETIIMPGEHEAAGEAAGETQGGAAESAVSEGKEKAQGAAEGATGAAEGAAGGAEGAAEEAAPGGQTRSNVIGPHGENGESERHEEH